MTITTQNAGSIARQTLAILGIIFGILSQSVSSLHLPIAMSTAITIAGSVLLAIQHYVADPSTGSTNAPPPVVVSVPAVTGVTPTLVGTTQSAA
jgi:hypothetical protein